MTDQIRYVKRKDIDEQKWDECIRQSPNGIVYAFAFYLDCMCVNWDALIYNDYEMIMPLPWKKKYGFIYLYQPYFVQQSGIFSSLSITTQHLHQFISIVKDHFQFAEIHLNFGNEGVSATSLSNFILPLNRSYQHISLGYKKDLKKNLSHAKKFPLEYGASPNYSAVIALFQKTYANRMKRVNREIFLRLEKLCKKAGEKEMLLIREVRNTQNEVLAAALCLKDERRIYLLLSATKEEGKKMEANHFLIDRLIHEFQNTDTLFDFEGSDIPGIAHFYKNFGSVDQRYYFLRFNTLPWPIRLLKQVNQQHEH